MEARNGAKDFVGSLSGVWQLLEALDVCLSSLSGNQKTRYLE